MMRKIYTILSAVLLTVSVFLPQQAGAQSPEKMSYQAVVRDASDNLVTSTSVGMQISILQGSESGMPVYVETQTPTTNANGLVSIEIGSTNATVVSGDFSTIDWVNSTYFIKTETDPTGGTSYTITGTSQLLSVPYALHAKTAESVDNINITGNETAFDSWDKDIIDDFDGQYSSLSGTPTNVSDFTNDAGYVTEFSEVDGSVTNEIQDLQLVGNNLTITNNGTATTIDLSTYLDNIDTQLTETEVDAFADNNGYLTVEVDGSVTNEIQDLQLVGNNLTITNNGTATTIDLSPYLDNTDTQLTETEVDAFADNNGYLETEIDGSVINEIQTISRTGLTVTLSNGGGTYQDSINTYTAGTGIDITNKVISTTGPTPLTIGDSYGGGIIFWLDASGQHGLIAATADQITGIQWYNGSHTITGATLDAVYAGKANVNLIINNQGVGSYAAQLCADYSVTVNNEYYDDWYLPSKYELNLLYHQKTAVGGFANEYYWSSTESSNTNAWVQYFGNGSQYGNNKFLTYCVRAVRAF